MLPPTTKGKARRRERAEKGERQDARDSASRFAHPDALVSRTNVRLFALLPLPLLLLALSATLLASLYVAQVLA